MTMTKAELGQRDQLQRNRDALAARVEELTAQLHAAQVAILSLGGTRDTLPNMVESIARLNELKIRAAS